MELLLRCLYNAITMSLRLYTPTVIDRPGCPCCMTPYLQTSLEDGQIDQSTRMRLAFEARGTIYNFELGATHRELEQTARQLSGSGSSNILLAKVGFWCAITLKSGDRIHEYVLFDLRLPGTGGREGVFSYDFVEEKYGGEQPLYQKIGYFYAEGRGIANPTDEKHGVKPGYQREDGKHDQYIRHTEQLLSAQLALPETALMLRNRLQATIRGNYPNATTVKVYTIGLHLHSTKTCCAPCEYTPSSSKAPKRIELKALAVELPLMGVVLNSILPPLAVIQPRGFELILLGAFELEGVYTLLGLMREEGTEGLLFQFQQIPANETLGFTFPRGNMRFLVTVGASETDATHRALPTFTRSRRVNLYFDITARRRQTQIFTTLFRIPIEQIPRLIGMDLTDKTVSISGSKKTAGTRGTTEKVQQLRKKENNFQDIQRLI